MVIVTHSGSRILPVFALQCGHMSHRTDVWLSFGLVHTPRHYASWLALALGGAIGIASGGEASSVGGP